MDQFPLSRTTQLLGITGSLFLSGAITSISIISIPAITAYPPSTPLLLQQWRAIFLHGAARAPVVAATACVSYAYTIYAQVRAGREWRSTAVAAVTTMAIVPFTLIFMDPTNQRLLAGAAGVAALGAEEASGLLGKWTRLNGVRGLLPLIGGLVGLWSLKA